LTNGIAIKLKKLLHSKGNNYQSEETEYGIGEKPLPDTHLTRD
jgi:hypothetical protein